MKKGLIYLAAITISLTSCRQNNNMFGMPPAAPREVADINLQNTNDDKAIEKYLNDHYLDATGKVTPFTSTITPDNSRIKLADLNPIKLPSGVIVIKREGAQPNPGTAINSTDVIRIMQRSSAFTSQENNGIQYTAETGFINTVDGSGTPEVDPLYFFARPSVTTASGKPNSYYEIEGFKEGLAHFKSFDKADSENYNLQGVIIVPSRAAFARDDHYQYNGSNWRNRTFVFNFQVYKTTPR